ncbi:hypothetical protein CcI49_02720 [Frankia sp. CcI49]|uniref:hypothetical protein n=1 Tax=Frankia sp. CcI49 TaxID=1745382 RepID=UPI0009785C1F|nr:hypothetical protein [Frankia sp. CcI49]ONH62308.1 hypothetical protein CcI49_02720 [Frankia sp. CcI49]
MSPEQEARAEADSLRSKLAATEAENTRLRQRLDLAEQKVDSYRHRAAAAQVDAERKERNAGAQLDRVLAELLRRGVATDLVPDSWRSLRPGDTAEAEMRAGWPGEVALTGRCRELEEAVLAAERHANEAHRRRIEADWSRDQWIAIAIGLGHQMGSGKGADLMEKVSPELLTERSRDRAAERAALDAQPERKDQEEDVTTWRNRAVGLARLVRQIPRLPAKPAKLSAKELSALVWAIRPAQADYWATAGEAPKLPPALISEACQVEVERAVDHYASHAEVIGKRFDANGFRTRALASLGVEVESTGDAA